MDNEKMVNSFVKSVSVLNTANKINKTVYFIKIVSVVTAFIIAAVNIIIAFKK